MAKMFNNNDILTYSGDLWLSQDYVLKACGVNPNYLRVAKSRANTGAKSWQHQTILDRCYFKYSSLPKNEIVKLDAPSVLQQYAAEVKSSITSIVTNAIYGSFKLFLNQMDESEARSAAVIHEASIYIKNNGISYSKSRFFEDLANEIKHYQLKYLPTTWRNLRDKIKAYSDGEPITSIVYAKNKGNANRSLFADNGNIMSWLLDLSDTNRNYSAATIHRKLLNMCTQNGIANIPSARWIRDWRHKPETEFLLSNRYASSNRFNHKYRSYTPMLTALYAGDCWDIDGTRINIIDHKATVVKNGKKTTSNKFLYIIAVRDVMSGMPLGWEYCYEESATAITNALAMAVRNTGYLPFEIRYDRFPGHNAPEWLFLEKQLVKQGVIMTQTSDPNAKASTERWFGTLQTVFMSESDLYYGEGVKSTRKHAHRSKEYVAKMRQWAQKNNFDFNDATYETDKILNAYINTPYSKYSRKYKSINQSPAELHEDCTKPNAMQISDAMFCYLFGLRKEVSIRNYMIHTEIFGGHYYYGIDDCEAVEKYTGIKLTNCFDYEDLSKVHLFKGGEHIGTFNQITPAQQYGKDKDMRAVGITGAIAKKMDEHRATRITEIQANVVDDDEAVNELDVLQVGRVPKAAAESAETAFLKDQWQNDDDIVINIRNSY